MRRDESHGELPCHSLESRVHDTRVVRIILDAGLVERRLGKTAVNHRSNEGENRHGKDDLEQCESVFHWLPGIDGCGVGVVAVSSTGAG